MREIVRKFVCEIGLYMKSDKDTLFKVFFALEIEIEF